MGEPVKVGVIGVGMGSAHIRSFLKDQDAVEVVAVADLDTNRMNKIVGLCSEAGAAAPRCFTDYHEMLTLDEIEVVIVATPNFLHAPMAADCLRAGKHVLVEKPPSNSVAGAQQILDAVRETGNRCMIGLTNRFREEIRRLKRIIKRDDFGEVYFAKTGWTRRRGIPVGTAQGWFLDRERSGGGPLIDLGVHVFDLTWWLMGCPKAASVTGVTYDPFIKALEGQNANVEDLAAGFVRFTNGTSLFVEASWASHVGREGGYCQILGTKAGIDVDLFPVDDGKVLKMHTEKEGDWYDITFPQFERIDWQPVLRNQLLYFVECIREGKENMADAEQGLELMRILCGLYESAAAGREIRLDT